MSRPITLIRRENWKKTWGSSLQRSQMIIGTILILIILFMLPSFFNQIEKRNGVVLNDAVLAAIPAHNVSWAIFTFIWGMAILMLIRAINKPSLYITYVWAFIFITLTRVVAISLVALNPPHGLIILTDPITGIFYGESTITKDLFFSGHTSTLILIFLCLDDKRDKIVALISLVAVAILLLIQHVHYTIDIIAAPIIVYPLYRLAKFLLK